MLKQRVDDADDFVRIEIQAALERQIPIVPVLVGKALVPSAKNLPAEIERLAFKQAAEVRAGSDLQTHLDRLIRGLDRLFAIPKAEEEQRLKEAEEAKHRAEETTKREQAVEEERRKAEERRKIAEKQMRAETESNVKEEPKRKDQEERKRKETDQKERASKEQIELKIKPPTPPQKITNSIGMEFARIPAGSFTMGSNKGNTDERTPHGIKFPQAFYLQTTLVTQGHWQKVMGRNPSRFEQCGEDCPVENVSWEDAKRFIEKLNQLENTQAYRLPTEAEWEYACRAGSKTKFFFGDDSKMLDEFAWYDSNSKRKTHPVGKKKPNAWGLYDMYGNVWEWVEDDWHGSYDGAPNDGSAWVDKPRGSLRVLRGGSWGLNSQDCRSAARRSYCPVYRDSIIGFRLSTSVTFDS
jgi:formylglycine-generating enzyme required for sulfatase activity